MTGTLDIKTLAICFGICCCLQCLAFYLQYKIVRSENGLGWWTLGSACMAFGFFTNFFREIKPLENFIIIFYNLTFLIGFSLIYIGVSKFTASKIRWRVLLITYGIAFLFLLYFSLAKDNISLRRASISIACGLLSLLSIGPLLKKDDKERNTVAKLLCILFSFNALWLFWLSLAPLFLEVKMPFIQKPNPLIITYLLLIITSTLWTFGLIILVNQKLANQLIASKLFLESTLNGLSANIALLDDEYNIILVNKAWKDFATMNGTRPECVSEGINYIKICQRNSTDCSREAFAFSEGIKSVLKGDKDLFTMEYACHSSNTLRWFQGRVTPFPGSGPKRVVVAHEDITERKLIEIALEESNKKLETITHEDGLTKIANRRHFDTVLANECNRHVRSGSVLSLLFLDIDYFKNYNDTYGHVQGDECLRSVARAMSQCLKRPTDLVARYGGEEFACLLPETNLIGAVSVAENIRKAIKELGIEHRQSLVSESVSVSIGLISLKCDTETMPDEVVRQADELLYQAKSEGRNRVKYRGTNEDAYAEPVESSSAPIKILWRNSYLSGNDVLDQQHMALVDLANNMLNYILSSNDHAKLTPFISNLLDHVDKHFKSEEKILKDAGYPQIQEHVAEHNRLLEKCTFFIKEHSGSMIPIVDILQCIVHDLVMEHMFLEDTKYHSYLKS